MQKTFSQKHLIKTANQKSFKLPERLLTSSKMLMSNRLVDVQKQILKKFDDYPQIQRDFVKKLFYNNVDQLQTIQQKISFLMMVVDEVDEGRLKQYLLRGNVNSQKQAECDTDTSIQYPYQQIADSIERNDEMSRNRRSLSPKDKKRTRNQPQSNLSHAQRQNSNPSYLMGEFDNRKQSPIYNCSGQQQQVRSRQCHQPHLDRQRQLYMNYSDARRRNSSQHNQIIENKINNDYFSQLNPQQSSYQNFTSIHRQRTNQNQLKRTQSLLQSQQIKRQLKRIKMNKKLIKHSHNISLIGNSNSMLINNNHIPTDKGNNFSRQGRDVGSYGNGDFCEGVGYPMKSGMTSYLRSHKNINPNHKIINENQNQPKNDSLHHLSRLNQNDFYSFRRDNQGKKLNKDHEYNNKDMDVNNQNSHTNDSIMVNPNRNAKQTHSSKLSPYLTSNRINSNIQGDDDLIFSKLNEKKYQDAYNLNTRVSNIPVSINNNHNIHSITYDENERFNLNVPANISTHTRLYDDFMLPGYAYQPSSSVSPVFQDQFCDGNIGSKSFQSSSNRRFYQLQKKLQKLQDERFVLTKQREFVRGDYDKQNHNNNKMLKQKQDRDTDSKLCDSNIMINERQNQSYNDGPLKKNNIQLWMNDPSSNSMRNNTKNQKDLNRAQDTNKHPNQNNYSSSFNYRNNNLLHQNEHGEQYICYTDTQSQSKQYFRKHQQKQEQLQSRGNKLAKYLHDRDQKLNQTAFARKRQKIGRQTKKDFNSPNNNGKQKSKSKSKDLYFSNSKSNQLKSKSKGKAKSKNNSKNQKQIKNINYKKNLYLTQPNQKENHQKYGAEEPSLNKKPRNSPYQQESLYNEHIKSNLIKRAKSQPYLMNCEILYPKQDSYDKQVIRRQLVDQNRIFETKQKIIKNKKYMHNQRKSQNIFY